MEESSSATTQPFRDSHSSYARADIQSADAAIAHDSRQQLQHGGGEQGGENLRRTSTTRSEEPLENEGWPSLQEEPSPPLPQRWSVGSGGGGGGGGTPAQQVQAAQAMLERPGMGEFADVPDGVHLTPPTDAQRATRAEQLRSSNFTGGGQVLGGSSSSTRNRGAPIPAAAGGADLPPPPPPVLADETGGGGGGSSSSSLMVPGKEKDWAVMTTRERRAVEMLGWTEATWTDGDLMDDSDDPYLKRWEDFSAEQQAAALVLGIAAQDFEEADEDVDGAGEAEEEQQQQQAIYDDEEAQAATAKAERESLLRAKFANLSMRDSFRQSSASSLEDNSASPDENFRLSTASVSSAMSGAEKQSGPLLSFRSVPCGFPSLSLGWDVVVFRMIMTETNNAVFFCRGYV